MDEFFTEYNREFRLPDDELNTKWPVLTPAALDAFLPQSQTVDWGHRMLDIDRCWSQFRVSGRGVKVAVLDTGMDLDHPDIRVVGSKDFTGSRRGADDVQGHGTHVGSTIGAKNNRIGVVGVAPECYLYNGKVLGDNGSGSYDTIAEGIKWAAMVVRADVINMSLGGDGPISPVIKRAIDDAIDRGIIVVVAAGNSGPYENTTGSPGSYTRCITVGAVDSDARVTRFSSRGSALDVCAPGHEILACYPGGRYTKLSGTSMATPYVAGVAALYVEACKRERVRFSQAAFESLAKRTAHDIHRKGFDTASGAGLIVPFEILHSVVGDSVPPSPSPAPAPAPSPAPAPAPAPYPDEPCPDEPSGGKNLIVLVRFTNGRASAMKEHVSSIQLLGDSDNNHSVQISFSNHARPIVYSSVRSVEFLDRPS